MSKFFQKLKLLRLARNKVIVLYGVFVKKDPDFQGFKPGSTPTPLELMQNFDLATVTSTYTSARKAIDKLIYFKHFNHYSLWCQSHGFTDTCGAIFPSWEQYKKDVIQKETLKEECSNFYIFSLTYPRSDLASILRIFWNCKPLLLSEEKPTELSAYLARNTDPETHQTSIPIYLLNIMDTDMVDGPRIKAIFFPEEKK